MGENLSLFAYLHKHGFEGATSFENLSALEEQWHTEGIAVEEVRKRRSVLFLSNHEFYSAEWRQDVR